MYIKMSFENSYLPEKIASLVFDFFLVVYNDDR